MQRVALHRFLRFGDGGGVVAEPDQQQRERVGRTIVTRIRALPHLERLARLELIAGHPVVVLVGDEQPLALADPVAMLVGEPARTPRCARFRRSRRRCSTASCARERTAGRSRSRARAAPPPPLPRRRRVAPPPRYRPSTLRATASSLLRSACCCGRARRRDSPSDRRIEAVSSPSARRTSSLRSTLLSDLRDRGAGVAVGRGERHDRRLADRRDAAFEHRLQAQPLTELRGDVVGHRRVRLAPHQLQHAADPLVRHEVEIRRLAEVNRDRLPQRAVEVGIRGAVRDVADQDRAALGHRGTRRVPPPPRRRRPAATTSAATPAAKRRMRPRLPSQDASDGRLRASSARRARRRSSSSSAARW